MLSVADAQAKVVEGLKPSAPEQVPLGGALGRVLSADLVAKRMQPPLDVSAMDGYAVRSQDVETLPASLKVVGTVAAGGMFQGSVGKGEAVRIFTGAPVPKGATSIVIQENTQADGATLRVVEGAAPVGRHIRRAGFDFKSGETLLTRGRRLTPRDIALAAAMNYPSLPCARPPRIGILATGDEIVAPGKEPGPTQIIGSSSFGLAAHVLEWGATVRDLGIARDDIGDIRVRAATSEGCDVLVTLGGASVGDHDLIQKALTPDLQVEFWKIAMRPGKPLIFGRYNSIPFLGLPGNPVSALVCALLFLKPIIFRLLGTTEAPSRTMMARLATALAANDKRQDYVRCHLELLADGTATAHPFSVQDSSTLRLYAAADALIVRPPNDPARAPGDSVSVLHLA